MVGPIPDQVTTDGHRSYPRAIRETMGNRVQHRTNRYLNNRLEQDHRGIKQRYYPMGIVNLVRELKSFPEKNAEGKEKAEEWGGRCEITPLFLLLLPDSIYEIAAA